MPVNLPAIDPDSLYAVPGVRLGYAEAGIKKPGRKDVLLLELAPGSRVAGVFTQNRFCAAPVQICREVLASGAEVRALVVNTGNANAGTGDEGLERARKVCSSVAEVLSIKPEQVLPFSTGVILEPLPHSKISAALPTAAARLAPSLWADAAETIMTTDIAPKASSELLEIDGQRISVTGIAKGSGMIHPNMATMLGYVATNAAIAQPLLQQLVKEVADLSFNCVTVDGDTSTNDSFILISTGQTQLPEITSADSAAYKKIKQAILDVSIYLAQAMARDGEGATKFMTIDVIGGKSVAECKQIAFAIAHSPLVKTAFFASDPNLGRILAAIGYAGVSDLDTRTLKLYLGDTLVAVNGGRNPEYQEEDGQRVMKEAEITIRVELNRGDADATVWTCDFSYDYVKINADYRS